MENSSNGGTDKRSWRERLGIGTKELPKISDDFKKPQPEAASPAAASAAKATAPVAPSPGTAKPAPRAPMAPKAPASKAGAGKPSAPPQMPMSNNAPTKPISLVRPTVVPKAPITSRPADKPSEPVRPAPRPASLAPLRAPEPAAIRQAPAPRPTPGPGSSNLGPTPNETLANRLKAQREAAEKLAEQRIQAARQRAEAAMLQKGGTPSQPGKPKFTFADDEPKIDPAKQPAIPRPDISTILRPAAPVPPPVPMPQSQMAPPRPPLGAERIAPALKVPQRVSDVEVEEAPPPFRQVDATTGYSPPPFQQATHHQAAPMPPRMPPRPIPQPTQFQPAFEQDRGERPDYSERADRFAYQREQINRGAPRAPTRTPMGYPENDDIFEQPVRPTRRTMASDYSQAYQEVETGYEDDLPTSRVPWVILLMLLLALGAAALGFWYYSNQNKPVTGENQQPAVTAPAEQTPVVAAPETPAKTEPEAQSSTKSEPPQDAVTAEQPVPPPSKKQIYDRIVGDREVLGGQIVPTEVSPIEPQNQVEQPADPQGSTDPNLVSPDAIAPAAGDDSAPLPLPPPPGDNGDQGALTSPPSTENQANSTISPTAAENSAALLPGDGAKTGAAPAANTEIVDGGSVAGKDLARLTASAADEELVVPAPAPATPEKTATAAAAPAATAVPAVSAAQPAPATPEPPSSAPAVDTSAVIEDNSTPAAASTAAKTEATAPVVPKPPVQVKAAAKPKAQTAAKAPAKKQKALGSQPVVLVPPSDGAAPSVGQVADNGIYGELPAATVQTPAATQPPKRKRTLADLLRGENAAAASGVGADADQQVASTSPAIIEQKPAQATQPQLKQPPQEPQTNASVSGSGYVVQLASFRSRSEANAEFSRIRARHSSAVNGLSPIVDEATVGGAIRYRLGLGPVSSRAAASQVCTKLFTEGERDCLVRRQ